MLTLHVSGKVSRSFVTQKLQNHECTIGYSIVDFQTMYVTKDLNN